MVVVGVSGISGFLPPLGQALSYVQASLASDFIGRFFVIDLPLLDEFLNEGGYRLGVYLLSCSPLLGQCPRAALGVVDQPILLEVGARPGQAVFQLGLGRLAMRLGDIFRRKRQRMDDLVVNRLDGWNATQLAKGVEGWL